MPYGVTVQNGVAFVADYDFGLRVINVSLPSAPTLLGSIDTPGNARRVTVHNGVALVGDYGSGLQIINVTIPSAPSLLGSYDTPGSARWVTVQNGVAFVADYTSGLQILDLGQTRLLGTLPATAMGPYNFILSATNENGEWIATDFQLLVNASSFSPSTSAVNPISNSTIGNSRPSPGLIIISIEVLYLEVGIETTLTTDHLSVSGFTGDPSQITYSILPSDDYTVTVNGIEQYLFSQGELGADFVSIRLEDSACFDYLNEIPVEVSDGTTTTDFNLLFVGDTASCANASTRLESTKSLVSLLVGTGLGMFAASRSAKEKANRMWTEVIEADEKIAEEMDEVQNFGCVNA